MSDFPFDMTPDEKLEEARRHIVAKNYNRALPLLEQVVREDRDNPRALWMYANVLRIDQPVRAIKVLERLVSIDPNNSKARDLLNQLRHDDDDDLFNDLPVNNRRPSGAQPAYNAPPQQGFDQPAYAAQAYGQSGAMPMQQPVINVNVENNSSQNVQQNVGMMGMGIEGINGFAYLLGLLFGTFGIFGVAHLITGKILSAIGWFIIGIVWMGILTSMVTVSSLDADMSSIACILVPLHFVLVWYVARSGARTLQVIRPIM